MSSIPSSVFMQPPRLLNMLAFIDSPAKDTSPSVSPWQACRDLLGKIALSEPHFHWEDLTHSTLVPSAYEFFSLENEFETIEDEELLYRDYCTPALDALSKFVDLEDGWDGFEAPAPSIESLEAAHYALRAISTALEFCQPPKAAIDDEGIPILVFDNGATYCSLSFYSISEVTLYQITRSTRENLSFDFDLLSSESVLKVLGHIEKISE